MLPEAQQYQVFPFVQVHLEVPCLLLCLLDLGVQWGQVLLTLLSLLSDQMDLGVPVVQEGQDCPFSQVCLAPLSHPGDLVPL